MRLPEPVTVHAGNASHEHQHARRGSPSAREHKEFHQPESRSLSTSDAAPMSRSASDSACTSPGRRLEVRIRSAGSLERVRQAGLRLQKTSLVLQMLLAPDLETPEDTSGTGAAKNAASEKVGSSNMAVCARRGPPAHTHGTPASDGMPPERHSSSTCPPVVRLVRMKSSTPGDDVLARIHGLLQQK